jgi:AraC-like DNA-binding protein
MSRSVFAARFTAAGGEPAMSYLGRWRMLLAADRLGQGVSIGVVARELGYGSESAFGAAFRRITGAPPGQSRARIIRSAAAGERAV